MAFPLKHRDQIRRGAGISLPEITIRRLDALAGGTGKRSAFVEQILLDGLERRYGTDWVSFADHKLDRVADREAIPA